MLIIRHEQLQALRVERMRLFVDRLMALFEGHWPEQRSQLGGTYREFIELSIADASLYGIDTEASIARYVNLCLAWGAKFELRPEHHWAIRILKDSSLRGALKVNELAFMTSKKLSTRPVRRDS